MLNEGYKDMKSEKRGKNFHRDGKNFKYSCRLVRINLKCQTEF